MTLILFFASEALAERRTVSYVTYSEGVQLLRGEAAFSPEVWVLFVSGDRVKGRLIATTPKSLILGKSRSFEWRRVEWVRVPSSRRSPSDVGKGFAAGFTLGAMLFTELQSLGHARLGTRLFIGATVAGAVIGSRSGRVDTGHYYVLRDDSNGIIPHQDERLTLPLLPLRPSPPLQPR